MGDDQGLSALIKVKFNFQGFRSWVRKVLRVGEVLQGKVMLCDPEGVFGDDFSLKIV